MLCSARDEATFVPDLHEPIVELNSAEYQYGQKYLDIAAGYQGTIVLGEHSPQTLHIRGLCANFHTRNILGLNRGANNLSNTIKAAKAAVSSVPSLYAIELGNEPVRHSRGLRPPRVQSLQTS
jgi:hypothetical protein